MMAFVAESGTTEENPVPRLSTHCKQTIKTLLTLADFDFSNCCICSMVGAWATESIGKSHTLLPSHAAENGGMHVTFLITFSFAVLRQLTV